MNATSMYRDGYHARSPEDAYHPSQSWCRALQARIAHDIPPGWRICGENVYARHSIAYRDLPSFFFVYSIWDEHNRALGADATREWCALLGLETVPEFYRGPFDEARIRGLMPAGSGWSDEVEGCRLLADFAAVLDIVVCCMHGSVEHFACGAVPRREHAYGEALG